MSKLRKIINGWKNAIIKDENIEVIAAHRMDICNTCPSKTNLLGTDVCGECHCPLIAKTRSLDSECPLGKWSA